MKERQNTKDNHIFRSIDTARKRNEYPIFNKEYPTDEGKAEYKRPSSRFRSAMPFHKY